MTTSVFQSPSELFDLFCFTIFHRVPGFMRHFVKGSTTVEDTEILGYFWLEAYDDKRLADASPAGEKYRRARCEEIYSSLSARTKENMINHFCNGCFTGQNPWE